MTARLLALALLVPCVAPAVELSNAESSRDLVLTVRFGSFRPNVDEQFETVLGDQPPPYEHIFGNRSELMTLGTVEMIITDAFGTLSGGLGIGYWTVDGKAVPKLGGGEEFGSGDATSFDIIPTQAQVSWRFDVFQEYVPLVPVFRAGLDLWSWTIRDDDGGVANFEPGQQAEGWNFGYHVSAGAHLLLDYFALTMADDFDRNAGVNNSYIAIEYQYAQIDDFGDSKAIRIGDSTVFIGFGLDI